MNVRVILGEHRNRIGTVVREDKKRNLYGLTFPFDYGDSNPRDEIKTIYWIHKTYVVQLDNQYREVSNTDG
jgi:hypothetical protein